MAVSDRIDVGYRAGTINKTKFNMKHETDTHRLHSVETGSSEVYYDRN